jgi:hypothetical protein
LQPGKRTKFLDQITDQFCLDSYDDFSFFSPKSLRVFSVASFSTVATSLADEFRQAQVEDQIQALKEELHQRKAGPGPPWPPWPEGLTSETSGN